MRLDDEAESQNVEDRRGDGYGGGGGFGLPIGGKSIGIGTVIIALAASYFFGIDPSLIFQGASVIQGQQQRRICHGHCVFPLLAIQRPSRQRAGAL